MRPALIVLVMMFAPVFAGCFGGESEAPAAVDEPVVANETEPNATLPDGRGQALAFNETNATEEGVGGMEHLHDYWEGQETVVLLDERIYTSYFPLFPDGEGGEPRSVAYVKLGKVPGTEKDALVYEGANKVTVTISEPQVQQGTQLPGAPHPAPPAMTLQYLTAADNAWRDAGALAWSETKEIEVAPRETDMPHSRSSLWVFRILTDKPIADLTYHMLVTVHKGGSVVDWPGHPDFYATSDRRTVLETSVRTSVHGAAESIVLYDEMGTWVNPEKLISWGTKELEVTVRVTEVTNDIDAAPDSYYLEYHNATIIGPEINLAEKATDDEPPSDLVEWDFVVPVDDYGMDGPYQPESRWGFRVRATYANGQLCPGCFNYDIAYDIKVVAVGTSTG